MIYPLDTKSQSVYDTLAYRLRVVIDKAREIMPIKLIEGFRDETRQNLMFAEGKSQVKWPDSKHNKTNDRGFPMSYAVDMAPAPIDWGDRERMTYLAGIVKGLSHLLQIPVRWGGDWDRDTELSDNHFDDLTHYELDGEDRCLDS